MFIVFALGPSEPKTMACQWDGMSFCKQLTEDRTKCLQEIHTSCYMKRVVPMYCMLTWIAQSIVFICVSWVALHKQKLFWRKWTLHSNTSLVVRCWPTFFETAVETFLRRGRTHMASQKLCLVPEHCSLNVSLEDGAVSICLSNDS